MKKFLFFAICFFGFSGLAHGECKAPESVVNLAKLLEQTFNGSKITCDDGNNFSSKFAFECKDTKYYSMKADDDLTNLSDGTKVYLVTVLSEENGDLKLTEYSYPDAESYKKGEKPVRITPTNFLSLSEKSFSLYSKDKPTAESWISSTWYVIEGETFARGYKQFAHRFTTCKTEEKPEEAK